MKGRLLRAMRGRLAVPAAGVAGGYSTHSDDDGLSR
jgi:hypothetical protein